jgi:predicted dehydrogenase
VCDIVESKAKAIADQFGVPHFSDMHELMRKVNPDVVVILTESGRHAEHTLALAPYGKHIVVEKPMALSLADADAMIAACDAARIKLFVVKQNRFNVPVMQLRKALEAGRFGKLVLGTVRVRWCRDQKYYDQDSWRGTWALDGGVLTNQASHHVDLLEWMMGDVESAYAMTSTALVNVETEDTAVVTLRFRNGALVVFVAAASPPARAPVETWPANGSAAAKAWPTPAALAGLEGPALPLPARAADLLVKPPDSEAPPSAGAGAASGGVDALLHALLTREVGARTSSVSGGGKRFRFRFPTREALPASLSLSLSLCTPPNHDHE